MCGIAGYYGKKALAESAIASTLTLMKNRGPDAQMFKKFEINNSTICCLLHSRLSIIDLDKRSNQPFFYKDKVLTYNGEIYNYLEIKDTLLRKGHKFHTESDTEVVIQALDRWGADAFNEFEGMWSLAFFSRTENKLLLSRDPFGEKPLYFFRPTKDDIFFGSEIKFLSSLSKLSFQPNLQHTSRFLVNGYKSLYKVSETFFENIEELAPGQSIEIKEDNPVKKFKYWQPKFSEETDMNFEEAVEGAREKLMRSVKLRLRSDVPIAFQMSGGVDSNALISIAKKVFNYDVHGFTISNQDKRYEEKEMIDASISDLGITHSFKPVGPENFFENMKALVSYHDGPIFTITSYLSWLLQKEIKRNKYKISISGTAADEIFSGYFDHQSMFFYDIRNDEEYLNETIAQWKMHVKPIIRNPKLQDYDCFLNNPFQREHIFLNNDIYSSFMKDKWFEPFSEKIYRKELLRNRMNNEIFHETTPMTLHEDDLNSMYFSIENRTPFLDRDLFSFCQSIPTRHLIKKGSAKAVLREAMRGIVPDAILDNRRKVGFNAPVFDILNMESSETKEKLLEDSPIFDIVHRDAIEKLISQNELPNSYSKFLFSFVSSKIFLEEFCR